MRNMQIRNLALAALATVFLSAPASAVESPLGIWRLSSGKVTVKIEDCGSNLCGRIVALGRPLDKAGKPKVDKNNPNPALRNRPMIGISVFDDMAPAGKNRWKGRIYYADNGSTYRATAELSGNRFTVRACWGPICQKFKFNRID
jgi:uncharacterized protein (DUF2147 family)